MTIHRSVISKALEFGFDGNMISLMWHMILSPVNFLYVLHFGVDQDDIKITYHKSDRQISFIIYIKTKGVLVSPADIGVPTNDNEWQINSFHKLA